jgi:hypothetical protein
MYVSVILSICPQTNASPHKVVIDSAEKEEKRKILYKFIKNYFVYITAMY